MKFWRWLVALASARETGTTLAVFRMAVASVVLFSLLSVALSDMVGFIWVSKAYGGVFSLSGGNWLLSLLGGTTPMGVWTCLVLAIVGATAMLSGIGGPIAGRVVTLITLQLYLALHSINPETTGGYDALIDNALWLLVIGNGTATLSLHARIREGSFSSERLVYAFPRYLAVFQLLIMYGFTGIMKVSAKWSVAGDYSALWYVYQDPTWRRFDMDWLAWVYPLTQLGSAVTWWWEALTPLLFVVLWYRSTAARGGRARRIFNRFDLRLPWMAVGVALHVGILVTLNVGPFSWISLAYYPTLFASAELEGLWQSLPGAQQ